MPSPDHVPVMLPEVLDALVPVAGEVHIDGTFGAGGYSRAILASGAQVIGFDRDPNAVAAASALDGLKLIEDRFATMAEHVRTADGVVLDIGVSSMQIDQAARGFSFQSDGPLDMRMSQDGLSAADVVNGLARNQLTRLIGLLGEERQAARVAGAIEAARPITTTGELVKACVHALGPPRGDRIHPATRTFQALRIFVNRELDELADGLLAAEHVLASGGRLVVVTFHSLEDRIVKRFIAARSGQTSTSRHLPDVATGSATFETIGKALKASKNETAVNPRARSATMRAARRTPHEPGGPLDRKALGVPDLSSAYRDLGQTLRSNPHA